LILVLGKSFRQESKFFAGTFNALPLLANLDDKAFTAAEVRYERTADVDVLYKNSVCVVLH
jgi:hypothetical protein